MGLTQSCDLQDTENPVILNNEAAIRMFIKCILFAGYLLVYE